MSRREHVKPVLRAFLHAKSADLLFLNNHKIPWLMYMISYCLFQFEFGLYQLQKTEISKKKFIFEVSISNRPFFCADWESANENSNKRFFWPPEGRKVEPPRAKNIQMAISRLFLPRLIFTFVRTFVRVDWCLRPNKIKIREILLLRLEFTMFWASGAVMKNF